MNFGICIITKNLFRLLTERIAIAKNSGARSPCNAPIEYYAAPIKTTHKIYKIVFFHSNHVYKCGVMCGKMRTCVFWDDLNWSEKRCKLLQVKINSLQHDVRMHIFFIVVAGGAFFKAYNSVMLHICIL